MARCESCGRRVRGVAVRDLGSRSALMCRACLGALVRRCCEVRDRAEAKRVETAAKRGRR